MNEHIHWGKLGVLAVFMISVAIVVFVMGKSVDSDDKGVPQKAPAKQAVLPEKEAQNDENTYVNSKYGFSLSLPKSWKKEKTIIREVSISEFIDNEPGISLGYALDTEIADFGKSLNLYNIYIIPLKDWKRIDKEVVWELGRNSTYVFGISPNNDLLATNQNGGQSVCTDFAMEQNEFCAAYADLKNILSSPEGLKKLDFKVLDEQIILYENKDYGFSLEFPASWKGYKTVTDSDSVNILLSAGEPGWSDTKDPSLSQYASILRLVMLPNTDAYLEDMKSACDEGPVTGCLRDYEVGRTNKYVVIVRLPQDIPQSTDFQKKWFDTGYSHENPLGFMNFFRNGFKAFQSAQ